MSFVEHFPQLLTGWNIGLLILGTAGGAVLGSIPGVNPAMLLVLLVAFTTHLDAIAGLVLLGAAYAAAVTVDAVDGRPATSLPRLWSAVCAGAAAGAALLLFFTPLLEEVTATLRPSELFWTAVLAVTAVSALGTRPFVTSLFAGAFGAWLSTVGDDAHVIPALIGLLALPGALELIRGPRDLHRRRSGRGGTGGAIIAAGVGSAGIGASLVPALTLGIPASAAAAVVVAGLATRGMFPGPDLFTVHAGIIGMFAGSLVVAQILVIASETYASRPRRFLACMPRRYVGVALLALAVLGTWAADGRIAGVLIMLALGAGMYASDKGGLAAAPVVVLGFVVGPFAHSNLLQGRMIAHSLDGALPYFCGGRINPVLIALCLVAAGYGVLGDVRAARRST